jgi:hypothetical protein
VSSLIQLFRYRKWKTIWPFLLYFYPYW